MMTTINGQLNVLQPLFSNIPVELTERSRWMLWRGAKVPYCPTVPAMKGSCSDPSTWGSFGQAQAAYEEGGFSGVGFALNNDGIVGIDLDRCVVDGTPDPAANEILDTLECSYIELSPSGNGLRAFGYAEPIKGTRGILNGVNVELYSTGRYLTVTGHSITSGPLTKLSGFVSLAGDLRGLPTERNRDDSSHISVLSVLSVGEAITKTMPKSERQRNSCLFELARWAKSAIPNPTEDQLRSIVRQWYEAALPFISTKEFTTSWYDFRRGLEKVRYPAGTTIKEIIGEMNVDSEIPEGIEALGYGDKGNCLVRICKRLQEQAGASQFFISARQAGELLGIHFTEAAKMLWVLTHDNVLQLVTQGAGNKASRYRYIWLA